MTDEIYTVSEAASVAGVSERTIRRRIKDDTLQAEKIGGTWLIERESLAEYVEDTDPVPA